ncbi:hypothetical protein CCH79_00014923 [Gambusia affinis]|uniref:Tetraspanin n=1 Tax=Gambusia affinis TaxID=33528 RepID=A0A315WFA5_GAMAF|nr:hypothetical protein CCH79_00014923 [Gambusia affinis]
MDGDAFAVQSPVSLFFYRTADSLDNASRVVRRLVNEERARSWNSRPAPPSLRRGNVLFTSSRRLISKAAVTVSRLLDLCFKTDSCCSRKQNVKIPLCSVMARGCICCVKYMLFLFNLFFWLGGCGLLGVGVWLSVSQGSFATLSPSFPALSAANLIITLGTVVMVTGFLGCLGAIKENKCLLLSGCYDKVEQWVDDNKHLLGTIAIRTSAGIPSGSEVKGFVVIVHDVSSDDDVADELLMPAQLDQQVSVFVHLQGSVRVGAAESVRGIDGSGSQSLSHGHPHVDAG